MQKQKSVFERMIEATEKTGDIMLRYQFQKDMFKSQLLSDNMLDRIADKVLARIAVKTDIMQAIMNIKEAFERKGLSEEILKEALHNAEDLRAAGYNEETVEALYESYLEEGTVIKGEVTLEKLMMAVDPDQAWEDFWENTNA